MYTCYVRLSYTQNWPKEASPFVKIMKQSEKKKKMLEHSWKHLMYYQGLLIAFSSTINSLLRNIGQEKANAQSPHFTGNK